MNARPSTAGDTAQAAIESGVDVLIALLYAPGATDQVAEPIMGITRLQKLLFLLWKEGKFCEAVPDLYNFQAYDFGPCMDDLYDDLEFAKDIGLVEINQVASGNEYEGGDEEAFLRDFGFQLVRKDTRQDFYLTDMGVQAGKDIFETLSDGDRERLCRIKRRFNAMPFFDLLRYVYRKYPAFAKKSVLSL